MALRVLLADESVTIKKVFQLALQDFAVEVTPVTVGLDVLQVAEKIKPDIVFSDVLLQKKNGYDVCRELKGHAELGRVPVVLIWSGFMEFDEARFKNSGADAHLEKPFDTQRLRHLVQSLVKKTQAQSLSQYLTFPKLPDFDEPADTRPAVSSSPNEQDSPFFPPPPQLHPQEMSASPGLQPASTSKKGGTGSWSMDSFESLETPEVPPVPGEKTQSVPAPESPDLGDEFIAVDLPVTPPKPPAVKKKSQLIEDSGDDEAEWVQKSLSNYKMDPSKTTPTDPRVKYHVPEDKIDPDTFISNTWVGKTKTEARKNTALTQTAALDSSDDELELEMPQAKTSAEATPLSSLTEKQLEAIIRAQSKEVIEKVVWQVLPEIATRIIERELERLLNERKKS